MAKGKGKGSQFERELCTRLSYWWTRNQRDDVFWRSTISGGRATARGRVGKSTYGQYGDVQAVDPIGEPLLKVVTIEAKCGYRGVAFSDLLDAGERMKPIWLDWLKQVQEAWQKAGSFSWLLVVKRDRRAVLVVFPSGLYQELVERQPSFASVYPSVLLRCPGGMTIRRLWAMRLNDFLGAVEPDTFRQMEEELCRTR